jgi:UDPglucose--hexose-1-phosphate uridylyltransferase
MKPRTNSSASELVQDELTEDWIVFAPTRHDRPDNLHAAKGKKRASDCCHLCPEMVDPREVLTTMHAGSQKVMVLKNKFPTLGKTPGAPYGFQEIIVEGMTHAPLSEWSAGDLEELIRNYGERIKAAKKDKRVRYILLFKNQGHDAGASQQHPHTQLWATELVSPRLLHERTRRDYLKVYRKCCPHCFAIQCLNRALVIFSDDHAVAFAHPTARFAYEVRILTKRHVDNISLLNASERHSIAKAFQACFPLLTDLEAPFNFYTQELVDDPDQHVEIRLSPRLNILGGLEISSGMYINPIRPEDAAKAYREAARKPL